MVFPVPRESSIGVLIGMYKSTRLTLCLLHDKVGLLYCRALCYRSLSVSDRMSFVSLTSFLQRSTITPLVPSYLIYGRPRLNTFYKWEVLGWAERRLRYFVYYEGSTLFKTYLKADRESSIIGVKDMYDSYWCAGGTAVHSPVSSTNNSVRFTSHLVKAKLYFYVLPHHRVGRMTDRVTWWMYFLGNYTALQCLPACHNTYKLITKWCYPSTAPVASMRRWFSTTNTASFLPCSA